MASPDRFARIAAVRRRTAVAEHAAAVRDARERRDLRDRIVGLSDTLVPQPATYSAAALGAGSELRTRLLHAVGALDSVIAGVTARTEHTAQALARADRRLERAEDERRAHLRTRAARQDERNAELAALGKGSKR